MDFPSPTERGAHGATRLGQLSPRQSRALARLLHRFGLDLQPCGADSPIPASYWGEPEAGLAGRQLFARPDTPVHSVLHEACHFVCLDTARRERLDRDAGGDDAEEQAVCLLQILLADQIPGYGQDRMLADMDAWGYSFRLGSARAWLAEDAADAWEWLRRHALIDADGAPTWRVRA